MVEKTPGQINFAAMLTQFESSDPTGELWSKLHEIDRKSYEDVAAAVRQPLLDKIAELEQRLDAIDVCDLITNERLTQRVAELEKMIKEEYEPVYILHKMRAGIRQPSSSVWRSAVLFSNNQTFSWATVNNTASTDKIDIQEMLEIVRTLPKMKPVAIAGTYRHEEILKKHIPARLDSEPREMFEPNLFGARCFWFENEWLALKFCIHHWQEYQITLITDCVNQSRFMMSHVDNHDVEFCCLFQEERK